MKILHVKKSRKFGSRFEALGVLGSKSCRKQTPIIFQKKWGSVFFNFLIRALLRPQIAIRICAIFSRVIFSLFWPLKIKISQKKLYGHNPLGMLNHIGFQNFKKVEYRLKIPFSICILDTIYDLLIFSLLCFTVIIDEL